MSVSTTLRYAIIEWTGTANSVTRDVVNDWNNPSFSSGNFFKAASVAPTCDFPSTWSRPVSRAKMLLVLAAVACR
jgi:hypothetical protein